MDPGVKAALVGGLAGALLSSGIVTIAGWIRNLRERTALLLAFATELVELFARTTMYYNQHKKGSISYSALYDNATDSNMLGKLAEVIDDAAIIFIIINLKARYFQIQRHVLDASKYASEQSILKLKYEHYKSEYGKSDETRKIEKELEDAGVRAQAAQGRAIAFFEFDEMLKWTETLLTYIEKHANGPLGMFLTRIGIHAKTSLVDSLKARLYHRVKEKYETDLSKGKLA
jgi:hypothetical protein